MREKILEMLEEKKNIPPLPNILHQLESKIGHPKSKVSDIAVLIETEPILSGRLIQLSNSVFFGGGAAKVDGLSDAIIRLGLKMILDLAYTLEIPKMFMTGSAIDQNKFWQHSLAVAVLSRKMAETLREFSVEPDVCYIAGLMHDMGIMVFNYLVPKEYGEFLKKIQGVDKPLHVLETKRFGIAHPELGALFIQKWWPLPPHVVLAVEKHFLSMSEKGKAFPVLLIVIMANCIANNYGMDHGLSSHQLPLDRTFLLSCGLDPDQVDDLVNATRESVHTAKEVLYK